MTSVRAGWSVMAVAVALVVLGPGVASAQSDPEPVPEDDLSRFERAMVASGLSVVVERGAGRLRAERDTTYTIMVQNEGEEPASVAVRVSVPPGMSEVVPEGDADVSDGFVEWPVRVDPNELATLRLTGEYAAPLEGERAGGPVRVALTACAVDEEDDEPIICATDISELEPDTSSLLWWLVGGAAAVVVVLATAGAGFVWWRHRRRSRRARAAAVT